MTAVNNQTYLKAKRLATLLVCLFLTGCLFETDQILFPAESGEKSPLKLGVMECQNLTGEEPTRYTLQVTILPPTQYVFVGKENEASLVTFHQVADNRYIVVSPRSRGGQQISIADVTETTIRFLDLEENDGEAKAEALAKQYGIAFLEGGMTSGMHIGGGWLAQRDYIYAFAKSWSGSKVLVECQASSSEGG